MKAADEKRSVPFGLAHAAMLVVVIVWGTNYTIVKNALVVLPTTTFMGVRFAIAAAAMAVILALKEGFPRLSRPDLVKVVLLGIVGHGLYQLLFMLGIARTTAANAGMLTAVSPLFIAGLAAAVGLEPITRQLAAGLALCVPGVALVVAGGGPDFTSQTRLGDLLVVASSATWAVYTVGLRTARLPLSTLRLTALPMLAGAPMLLIASALTWPEPSTSSVPLGAWVAVVYSALGPLVLGYVLWSFSVRRLGSGQTALFGTGTPAVAALTAWLARGERPGVAQLVGAALILAGVFVTRQR